MEAEESDVPLLTLQMIRENCDDLCEEVTRKAKKCVAIVVAKRKKGKIVSCVQNKPVQIFFC